MMHLFRLLEMASKIGNNKGLKVRSDNVDFLIDIRKGKYDYEFLLNKSEEAVIGIRKLFSECDLQESPNIEFAKELLLQFRNNY